ncbi:MAG: hypothetical protein EOP62_04165 [Sphingomonadales bacterium]|nr:MAG: hypothetical protein EOP62_04165 [Sphingomonadales bacterium]
MNEATRDMLRRDPLISLTTLRFFKLAGVNPDQFLAGLRRRTWGARMDLRADQKKAPKVAQLVASCGHGNGCGLNHYVGSNASYLHSVTRDFNFSECHSPEPEFKGTNLANLTLHGQQIPETVLTAVIGRPLTDLVGSDRKQFFLSRHTRILAATAIVEDRGSALKLVLGDKWMPLSRFLKLL